MKLTGIPSGFAKLDEMTSGMRGGELLTLAARPPMGKTMLAMSIAVNAAKTGHAVGVFSLEMSTEGLVLRMLLREAKIPYQKIKDSSISPDEWIELTNTASELSKTKLFLDDSQPLNIIELCEKIRKLKKEQDIELIIIDYIQLINGLWRGRSLKALCKELNISVVAISEFDDLYNNDDGFINEDGIEQAGDIIFSIYRDKEKV